jgi:hypothetical protein
LAGSSVSPPQKFRLDGEEHEAQLEDFPQALRSGRGRSFLRPDAIEYGFGLRVALNAQRLRRFGYRVSLNHVPRLQS